MTHQSYKITESNMGWDTESGMGWDTARDTEGPCMELDTDPGMEGDTRRDTVGLRKNMR